MYKSKTKYLAPLLLWGAILFYPRISNELQAQSKSQISASVYASSLFINTNDTFFDGTSISITYSLEVADYVNGFIDVGALTAIETRDDVNFGLDRFSIGYLTLNVGGELILVEANKYSLSIGVGGGLRKRKEVFHSSAIEIESGVYFTLDEYINTTDVGALIQMKHSFKISTSVSIGLLSRFHVYNEGDSVFDLGITLGKQF